MHRFISALLIILIISFIYKTFTRCPYFNGELFTVKRRSHFDSNPSIQHPIGCGWKVILSKRCPYCVKQVNLLNALYPSFNGLEYDKPSNVVPTWYNTTTGETREGFQDEKSLRVMFTC